MPPRIKYSREAIIDAAFAVVRRDGWDELSARSIARELKASTRPIYSSMESMQGIEDAVVKKALDLYLTYLTKEYTGDPWIDTGIGYILFARDEKQLFKAINDESHSQLQRKHSREIWSSLAEALADYPSFSGLDQDLVRRIRVTRWMLVHGLACLITSGWMQLDEANRVIMGDKQAAGLDEIVRLLSDALRIGLAAKSPSDRDHAGGQASGRPDTRDAPEPENPS